MLANISNHFNSGMQNESGSSTQTKGVTYCLMGYSEEEFERICYEIWAHGSSVSPERHLRTMVDLLVGYYMLARGGDCREAEISDLFTFKFVNEGPTRCFPVILTTRGGK
jgi:Centromere DNA-binding protein complex CBF3 subunit, domain 2